MADRRSSAANSRQPKDPFSPPEPVSETSIYPPQPTVEIDDFPDEDEKKLNESRYSVPWYRSTGDFLNTLKAFIGTNYQALPFAFHQSGLAFGIVGVFIIACLTNHCCQLLIQCKNYVIDSTCRTKVEQRDIEPHEEELLRVRLASTIGYGDLGKRALGGACFHLIQVTVWITQFSTCISYFIFIGNTIYAIFPLVPASYELRNSSLVNQSVADPAWDHVGGRSTLGQGVPMLNILNLARDAEWMGGVRDVPDGSESQRSPVFVAEGPIYDMGVSNGSVTLAQSTAAINGSSTLLPSTVTSTSTGGEKTTTAGPYTATSAGPSTTTSAEPYTTASAANETTLSPTPAYYWVPDAPALMYVVLFPLPFFILTSMIRKVRYLAPFSTIATVALAIGACSVLGFMIANFEVVDFEWYKFATLPLFMGQLISAYEGIGCIIPIESSMTGNRHLFPGFLHGSVSIVFLVLCSFGILGYLSHGDSVSQMIVLDIPQHSVMAVMVDVTLIISVLFTYPLQCYPVIDILEIYLFSGGRCCRRSRPRRQGYTEIGIVQEEDDERQGLLESSVEVSTREVSVILPSTVAGWKRNLVRLVLTACIAGLAILLKDDYAYLGAFTGAVGCSLLAYILPCLIHLKLRGNDLSRATIAKDIIIIAVAVAASILTLVAIVRQVVAGKIIKV